MRRPTGRPRSPNPTFVESALLNDAGSGTGYLAASIDWKSAENQLSEAENRLLATAAGKRRIDAETRHIRTVAAFLATPVGKNTYSELLATCEEIQKLRIELLPVEGGAAREIALVQQDAKAMRSRAALGPDTFLVRYNAETDSLLVAAASPEAMQRRVTERLVAAKVTRDRLKAAPAKRR